MHYNGVNSYLSVNGKKIRKFKAKDSANVRTPLCVGNISKDWSVNNMTKAELNEYEYEFCVDYGALSPLNLTETIPIIHNYFIPKYKIK